MPARIKYKEGDYVDPEHNLLFIRDVPSKINGRRRIGVYDLEYDEYFEACLNDLRRGHTKHSWNTSYQIRSKKKYKMESRRNKRNFWTTNFMFVRSRTALLHRGGREKAQN